MGDYGQYVVPTAEEMINFKVGQPAPSMLPLDKIRECATLKFAETDPMFLQYGHIKGYPKFRQSLAEFLTKGYGAPVDPEKLFITNGVTGGIALVCSLFAQAGDLVFMEEPSYFLALSIMKDFKINVRQIRMEEDGLDVVELERLLKRGIIPKMLYTIPTCHNPTGRTMSIEKRKKLVELSVEYNFMIVADEVYQLLSFPHVTPPPPFFTFDAHGTVLALGSFSKILAPALRLGWIQGSPKLLSTIINSGQLDSSGGISPVISGIVHAAITSGKQQEHLDFAVETLWQRADALMKELKKSLPAGTTFEAPNGGYFVLVRLPEHMNAAEMLSIAEKHKVMYLPGSSFSESMKNYLRLSFSWYDYHDLELGARRLGDAIREYETILASKPAAPATSSSSASASNGHALRVAVHGAAGRLGSLIVSELLQANDHSVEYAGAIDLRKNEVPAAGSYDVIVDVTLPEGTKALIAWILAQDKAAFKNGKYPALVVGTTGSLPSAELEVYGAHAPVVLKSNFSVGVPLVCELIKAAAFKLPADGWNVEVSETHHTKKLDAPSGTAKTIVKSLVSTGAACIGEAVPTHSLRLGDEIGQHTVLFAGPGERIEIKHQATRREVFAIGAVRTAKSAVNMAAGVHTD
ncbi:Dihydrodipicolinate reductase [Globisporangium polare]